MNPAGNSTEGPDLLLSFYGDDLTGSTDVMETLELAGVPTALFLGDPGVDDLARHPGVRAVGVAGTSRTMSVTEMDDALPDPFRLLSGLAPVFHYKVCSTFDSSPAIGSIGRAIEIARSVTGMTDPMPMVIGAPALGRYCVFGELYVRAEGVVCRLDRHPTLPDHPVTPMREADLLRHLSFQTALPTASIDILALDGPAEEMSKRYAAAVQGAPAVLLFDVLTPAHLEAIGALLWPLAARPARVVIGSSGVEAALVAAWRRSGVLGAAPPEATTDAVEQVLVLVGSCSATTRAQTNRATEQGYTLIRVPQDADPGDGPALASIVAPALDAWAAGRSVMVCTALSAGDCDDVSASRRLGSVLAEMAAIITSRVAPRRIVVAGGDTSGRVAARLGIESLRMIAPIAPGAPLCRAHSADPAIDGMEIALKGGGVGGPDYFERVRLGRA